MNSKLAQLVSLKLKGTSLGFLVGSSFICKRNGRRKKISGRHMVKERRVISYSSSPAGSQSAQIPQHRWDDLYVWWGWERMCVSLDIFVMADDDEKRSGRHH